MEARANETRQNQSGAGRWPVWTRQALAVLLLIAVWLTGAPVASGASPATEPPVTTPIPSSFRHLIALSPEELESLDIAAINLLCAQGLPGAEKLDVQVALRTLDSWANRVQQETVRNLHRFRENPADADNSEAKWRMLMLITVLQKDLNIRYNPNRIESPDAPSPNDSFFADSNDVLLNGLLGPRRTGTCSSMPVLYVAVGRRLGYPLRLVATRGHLFVRWEDKQERFNFEGSGLGGNFFPDDHYRQWPYPVTEAEVKAAHLLQSMTATEELAVFLSIRAAVLESVRRMPEAQFARSFAHLLVPENPEYARSFAVAVFREIPLSEAKPPEVPEARQRQRAAEDSIAEVERINRQNREMMEGRSRNQNHPNQRPP